MESIFNPFQAPPDLLTIQIGYVIAGVLTFFGLLFTMLAPSVRVRVAGLVASLVLASVHLYLLMTLIFSYFDEPWSDAGSAGFHFLGHGFTVMFAFAAAFVATWYRRPAYCLLLAVLSGFNLSPNDQQYNIQSMGLSWLIHVHLWMFLFVVALSLVITFSRALLLRPKRLTA